MRPHTAPPDSTQEPIRTSPFYGTPRFNTLATVLLEIVEEQITEREREAAAQEAARQTKETAQLDESAASSETPCPKENQKQPDPESRVDLDQVLAHDRRYRAELKDAARRANPTRTEKPREQAE